MVTQLLFRFAQTSAPIDTVSEAAKAADSMSEAVSAISTAATPISEAVSSLSNVVASISEGATSIAAAASPISEAAGSITNAVDPISKAATAIASGAASTSEAAASIATATTPISDAAITISDAADSISTGVLPIANAADLISQAVAPISEAAASISKAAASFSEITPPIADAAASFPESRSPATDAPVPQPDIADTLQQVIPGAEPSGTGVLSFFPSLFLTALAIGLGLGFYTLAFPVLRNIFRQFKSDLPLVALGTSRLPLTLVIISLGLNVAFHSLPNHLDDNFLIQGLEKVLLALAILSIFYWITQLFSKVVIYALKEFTAETEAAWDDVLVPFFESTIPIVLYGAGIFLALQAVGIDLSGLWVTLGGAAFVLGFAAKDILSNFFSGLVLLIDTPFRFGDVILHNDERAIVRQIGLRTTKLYLIDTHCEVFVPNSSMQGKDIVNLSRPTPHYYYTVSLSLPPEVDPQRASTLMQDVVLAHPDTLGDIDHKLKVTDEYFGFSGMQTGAEEKREAGRTRLKLEQIVNEKLEKVEALTSKLKHKIKQLEEGGLDETEVDLIKHDFLDLCQLIGLSPQTKKGGFRGDYYVLDEDPEATTEDSMIHSVRTWYDAWLKDPNLVREDREFLPEQWEQKIGLLKKRLSRFYRTLLNPEGQETRLDDYIEEIEFWLRDSFKSSRNEWQFPKVWIADDYTVRFYIDDITLENGQRGLRIQSEVHRELIWHLRQSYLLRR
jgi:MscS family membrane protein